MLKQLAIPACDCTKNTASVGPQSGTARDDDGGEVWPTEARSCT